MAKQTINIGASPNDGTGTPLRTSFDYCNQNFTELYTATGPSGNNIVVPGNATITGDLTVDTSTLKVDSANNRVGIGTASPSQTLQVLRGGNGITAGFSGGTYGIRFDNGGTFSPNGSTIFGVDTTLTGTYQPLGLDGSVLTFGISGSEQMRLNSTGLGVGGSPAAAISVLRTLTGTASSVTNILRLDSNGNGNTTKITLTDGVTSDSYITHTGGSAANQLLGFGCQGVQQLVINSSGNVGVGVTPSAYGTGIKGLDLGVWTSVAQIGGSSFYGFNAYASTTGQFNYKNTGAIALGYQQGTSGHLWYTAPSNAGAAGAAFSFTTAMTLDASGNLLVGTTSGTLFRIISSFLSSSGNGGIKLIDSQSNNTAVFANFSNGTGTLGSITNNNNAGVSYNINSDYRLKESVQPLTGGLARVKALKPSIYKWKSNGSDGEGFLAHELAEVVPSAVTGEKDAVNQDGTIKAQGVDLSKVVPILVAAIQELTARVEALEA